MAEKNELCPGIADYASLPVKKTTTLKLITVTYKSQKPEQTTRTTAEFAKRMHEKDHFVTRVLESQMLMIIGNEKDLFQN